ncbi:glycosyltransferase [Salinimicrobium tongyeongense]|uniref:Glycosyltransferase n=1 Tax=Salinimicrobium tongyeongense TaxID=2809707 RepID=A0ABY6NPK2_9FLAO|nr:glycosyltransferase [Salinimicrobium tongyeongense]UZH54831.1 glycosyltransferase [Salinimicrobium tongyeongense]
MKVLHLSTVKSRGGGENHIENLCLELAEISSEVSNVILCRKGSLFEKSLKKGNFNYYSSAVSGSFDFRYIQKIIQLSKNEKIDLIHIHDPKALSLAVVADHFFALPPFIFSKKTSFPIRPRRQTLLKYNYPKIKHILCVSEETKRVSLETLKDHDRLEVIYHGTSLKNKDQICPFWIRREYTLPETAKIIGNIGNHIAAKDLKTFIRTADFLVNKKKQKHLYFLQVGNFSELTPALKALVQECNLQNHLFFTGFIPDASALIPQFDIMLISSESEGVPQVIYESFYYEVPVVSTRVGGIPEVINDKINGLLSAAYDFKGLGENLLFLLENPQLIPNFAKISRERLFKSFTSQIMAVKTLEAYKNALNGRLH